MQLGVVCRDHAGQDVIRDLRQWRASGDWADECLLSLEKQAHQNKIMTIKARMGAEGLSVEEVNRLTKELLDLQARRNDIAEA